MLAKDFTLCGIYCSNQVLWKIHGIVKVNFDCLTIDGSNQVKISHKITWCEGYFLNVSGDEVGTKHPVLVFLYNPLLNRYAKKTLCLRIVFVRSCSLYILLLFCM